VRVTRANLDDLDRLFRYGQREKGKIDVLFRERCKARGRYRLGEITERTSMRPSA